MIKELIWFTLSSENLKIYFRQTHHNDPWTYHTLNSDVSCESANKSKGAALQVLASLEQN